MKSKLENKTAGSNRKPKAMQVKEGTRIDSVLRAYKTLNRATQREVKELTGFEINIISARTNELLKMELIKQCGKIKDCLTRRTVHVYAYNHE